MIVFQKVNKHLEGNFTSFRHQKQSKKRKKEGNKGTAEKFYPGFVI